MCSKSLAYLFTYYCMSLQTKKLCWNAFRKLLLRVFLSAFFHEVPSGAALDGTVNSKPALLRQAVQLVNVDTSEWSYKCLTVDVSELLTLAAMFT